MELETTASEIIAQYGENESSEDLYDGRPATIIIRVNGGAGLDSEFGSVDEFYAGSLNAEEESKVPLATQDTLSAYEQALLRDERDLRQDKLQGDTINVKGLGFSVATNGGFEVRRKK